MKYLKGTAASTGIAIAPIYKFAMPDLTFQERHIMDPHREIRRFFDAIKASTIELELIKEQLSYDVDELHADIFTAQILLLRDSHLIQPAIEHIESDYLSAETAFKKVSDEFINLFQHMENEYMKERAADLTDLSNRVLSHLLGVNYPDLALIDEEVIIVAHELTPSDTASLNKNVVKGFSTEIGGPTSHSAIIARSLNIPAIVGVSGMMDKINHGDLIIVDTSKEQVILDPSERLIESYEEKYRQLLLEKKIATAGKHKITITTDNKQVIVGANICAPNEVDSALESGARDIGLYRTEFLYLNKRTLPTENEQFNAYRSVLKKMDHHPVTIRTIDIGGDKPLPSISFDQEENPALGARGIRFCLENESLFRTQLRAILRASVYGNLKIIFPMVTTVEEFRQAKNILLEEKQLLQKAGVDILEDIPVGLMIETPSAALMARQLAKEADFFSIGTNDLVQYTIAADRMNEKVSHLYQPYHPSVLQLIYHALKAAKAENIRVTVCGEMAGDPVSITVLLSLGINSFSMNASSIITARNLLEKLSRKELLSYRHEILAMTSAEEVETYMKEKLGDIL